MKVELIKGWNGQSPGAILEPAVTEIATRLIERGIAKPVDEPKPKKAVRLQEWVKS